MKLVDMVEFILTVHSYESVGSFEFKVGSLQFYTCTLLFFSIHTLPAKQEKNDILQN